MDQKVKLAALLAANQLDLKGIKALLERKAVADSSSELFYDVGSDKYQYYFNYGVIVFSGHTDEEIKQSINIVTAHLKGPVLNWLRDDHEIAAKEGEMTFEFNQVEVNHFDHKVSDCHVQHCSIGSVACLHK